MMIHHGRIVCIHGSHPLCYRSIRSDDPRAEACLLDDQVDRAAITSQKGIIIFQDSGSALGALEKENNKREKE
jgi:hypothetical protein